MNESLLKIYKTLNVPVIVLSSELDICFTNDCFVKTFGKFSDINKFIHNFNFNVCILENANITKYNPVSEAIKSDCNFSAQVLYQNNKNEVLVFELSALKEQSNTIILFSEQSQKEQLKELKDKLKILEDKYNKSLALNKHVEALEQQSREQAVNMALINKIFHQIRHSIKLDVIINTAIKELLGIIGGFKGYWATPENDAFVIQQIYPDNDLSRTGKIIQFDKETTDTIFRLKIDMATCLKEYNNSDINYKKGVHRILIPVGTPTEFFGVLVLLTNQKGALKPVMNVLKALSTQLATEIMQASLFEKLNDKNTALENTLSELKETQLQLINSEKMASLGHLIAGIAHEINTPVGSINANNSLIKKLIEKFAPQVKSTHKKYLNMLIDINKIDSEAIKRISKIVVSLKKFVRLDEADFQETNINNELDLTLALIHHETKNRIEVIKNYSELPPVRCYPNMLNQVFMNILVNACQSIEKSGKIFVSTGFRDNELTVSIKDTGCGMNEETKKQIFTPGFTTKGVGVGTGIGLAITYKIIEKHNGKITVNSQKGVGTEFIISIPTNSPVG